MLFAPVLVFRAKFIAESRFIRPKYMVQPEWFAEGCETTTFVRPKRMLCGSPLHIASNYSTNARFLRVPMTGRVSPSCWRRSAAVSKTSRSSPRPAAAARLPNPVLPSKPTLRWEAAAAGFGSTAALRHQQSGDAPDDGSLRLHRPHFALLVNLNATGIWRQVRRRCAAAGPPNPKLLRRFGSR